WLAAAVTVGEAVGVDRRDPGEEGGGTADASQRRRYAGRRGLATGTVTPLWGDPAGRLETAATGGEG
ncbi:MAG: hypothetical protein O3A92_07305, partial [Verrucomicrobia bacterium]|nr:hypothetical protein [Verrucomicrobiota bacterium]